MGDSEGGDRDGEGMGRRTGMQLARSGRARERTTHPGKWLGVGMERGVSSVGVLRARRKRGPKRREEEGREEPALWRCTSTSSGVPVEAPWLGGLPAEMREAGLEKCVAGRRQKSLGREQVAGRSASWHQKNKKKKSVWSSCVVRASSAWSCLFFLLSGPATRERKAVVVKAVLLARLSTHLPPSRRDRCPTCFRGQPPKQRAALTATSEPRWALSRCAKGENVGARCLAAGAGHARVPMARNERSIAKSSTGCWRC